MLAGALPRLLAGCLAGERDIHRLSGFEFSIHFIYGQLHFINGRLAWFVGLDILWGKFGLVRDARHVK